MSEIWEIGAEERLGLGDKLNGEKKATTTRDR